MSSSTTSHLDGAAIRAARERVGLTQRQLAEASRCSLAYLANIEHGLMPRTSAVLPRIHAALVAQDEDAH